MPPSPAEMLVRLAVMLVIWTCVEYYAYQAMRTVTANFSFSTQRILEYVWWSIPILFVCTIFSTFFIDWRTLAPVFKTTIQAFFIIAIFSKLIMASTMLIDDLRRAATFAYSFFATKEVDYASRSKFLATSGMLLAGLPFATLTYGMIRNMYRYSFKNVDIPIPNLAEGLQGLKIVQLSDIHSGTFSQTEPIIKAVEKINAEKPDLVFFTGDLVNNIATEIEPYIDIFGKIEAKYGVFSVLGNHDYGDYYQWSNEADKKQNFQDLLAHHAAMGWDLLNNVNRILDINGAKLAVLGVENFGAKMNFHRHGRLDVTHKGTDDADMRILLSHDPSHWDYEVNQIYKNIELTLSGHTHGFQFGIEIPGWIKWSPAQFAYKQWAGLYKTGAQFLYVNRGFGALGYPGRVGILPEVTVLRLVKG